MKVEGLFFLSSEWSYGQLAYATHQLQANSQDWSVKNKRVLTVKTKVKDYKFCDSMIKKGL